MSYQRRSFQLPATDKGNPAICEGRGFHVASGPTRRRTCTHCGVLLPKDCPERVDVAGGDRIAFLDSGARVSNGGDPGGDIVQLLTDRERAQSQ